MTAGRLELVEPDGQVHVLGPGGPPSALIHVRDPRAWTELLRGSRGLASGYVAGLWESSDPTAVVRVAARNAPALDAMRRRMTLVREPYQRLRGVGALRHPLPVARGHSSPLRPRQRPLRAHARRDADVQRGVLRDPRDLSARRVDRQARARLRQARSARRGPRDRDRRRLGRLCHPRGDDARLSRHDDDDLRRAARPRHRARRASRPRRSRDRAGVATIATCPASTRRSSRSR